ncbi:MAG: heme exporter protein CcmB [Thiofilum sp.]|uniref:heme exporter protein CcmB n=1 Tax=Thiofilum sp. TaxID=2212733 RepID=UPI0025D4DB00|nr:heme exporter protein CcmB [Thiofilum sp.]MBK8453261.1 heme exporter protein CcmB [Thiofilum sp.]
MRRLKLLIQREVLLAWRRRSESSAPLLFLVLVVVLFAFGIGVEGKILQRIASGVIWVATLLAILLASESLFKPDYEDGSLEQLVLSPYPLSITVLVRVLVQCSFILVPLLVLAPLIAVMLEMTGAMTLALVQGLVLGVPTLSLIAAIGSALTVSLKQSGMLLALVVLPLYIPVLIFASSTVELTRQALPITGQLYSLAGLLVLSVSLAPWAIASALRVGVAQT